MPLLIAPQANDFRCAHSVLASAAFRARSFGVLPAAAFALLAEALAALAFAAFTEPVDLLGRARDLRKFLVVVCPPLGV